MMIKLITQGIKTVLFTYLVLPSLADAADISILFSQALPGIAGESGQILTVAYTPGESPSQHDHNANTFVYVPEGSVVIQVHGGKEKVLRVGENFYEDPDAIHTVSKKNSTTESAKTPVFSVKDTGAPPGYGLASSNHHPPREYCQPFLR